MPKGIIYKMAYNSFIARVFCLPLIILLILIIFFPIIAFADADKIFKENNNAVVVITTYDRERKPVLQGSGFIVREDGAIVTNYHVISAAVNIEIKAGDKILKVEGFIHIDKENDLVILKSNGEKLPVVKLGDIEKTNVGEKVYVISSPQGIENTISDGILSGIREIDSKRKVLQITAPVSAGSSGGPVFNKNGEVIGIATFLIEKAQNLNFAMPINLIKDKVSLKKIITLEDAGIENYEKTAEYWVVLGWNFFEAGLYEDSIKACRNALKINPNYALAHSFIGLSYLNLYLYKEAIEAFKQTVRINPDDGEAFNNMGLAYNNLGLHKEAVESYKQAIKINPSDAIAYYNLGTTYVENLGMYKEAIEYLQGAIRLNPNYSEAYSNLGNVYFHLSMINEAIEVFKKAVSIKPNDAISYNNLGYSYDKSGMYKEAIQAYKQAVKIKPDFKLAHINLGNAFFKLNMHTESLQFFKQVIKNKPDFAEAHYYLGIAYLS